jgi:beta-1,4-mannosyltransferase
MKKAAVFVYGDIGRSPRMQNHAEQLSQTHEVHFFGYFDTSPRIGITRNDNIHLVDLQIKRLQVIRKINFYLYAFVRIILQILQILYLFAFKHKNFEFVLIQVIFFISKNPPSIPNLFALWLASFIGRYQIYIDFHNYGYTILNLGIKNHLIIKLAQSYERFFGKNAKKAFCVSDKMK